MGWKGEYQPGSSYAELVLEGTLTKRDITEFRDWLLKQIADNGITGDLTDLTAVKELPYPGELTLSGINTPFDVRFRRALVVTRQLADDVRPYETSSVNRYHEVRLFLDRDEAIAWLTAP